MTLPPAWISAIEDYSRAQRRAGLRAETIRLRSEHLRHLARRVDVDPWAMTVDVLRDYVDEHGARWQPATRRSRRTTLRGFYAWALDEGLVDENPARVLPRVKPAPPRPRPLPDDVFERFMFGATARERLILRLAVDAGLRRGEIAVVHSDDVFQDLVGWSLHVHGKGGRDRLVPLTRRLAEDLRALPPGWAFPGDVDGHLSPRWVGKLINRRLPGDWTIHAGRHRAATRVARTSRIEVAQRFLGHASVATTQVYVYVGDDEVRAAVDAAAS